MTDNPTPPVSDPAATQQATGEPGADRQLQTMAAIRSHHQALGQAVDEGALAVLDSVDRLTPGSHRGDLVALCEQVVLPHAVAEEHTLYLAGSDLPGLALLVRAMLDEHVTLRAVVDSLAQARTPGAIAGAAASLRTLFATHLHKENELLLPALVEAGVDIATLLDGMHEILGPSGGHDHGHDHNQGGCACGSDGGGCGCGGGDHGGGGCGCGGGGHDHGHGHGGCACADGAEATHISVGAGSDVPDGTELDVRALPHAARHTRIFSVFGSLAPGGSFVLVNDHDPRGLRYQFDADHAGRFNWDYVQAGPDVWKVRIGRVAATADGAR